jgi:hypothetical protein
MARTNDTDPRLRHEVYQSSSSFVVNLLQINIHIPLRLFNLKNANGLHPQKCGNYAEEARRSKA